MKNNNAIPRPEYTDPLYGVDTSRPHHHGVDLDSEEEQKISERTLEAFKEFAESLKKNDII